MLLHAHRHEAMMSGGPQPSPGCLNDWIRASLNARLIRSLYPPAPLLAQHMPAGAHHWTWLFITPLTAAEMLQPRSSAAWNSSKDTKSFPVQRFIKAMPVSFGRLS